MKLTPWFSGDQKPVRVGVYQRKYINWKAFAYWNGSNWGYYGSTTREALSEAHTCSENQNLPWRGVLK